MKKKNSNLTPQEQILLKEAEQVIETTNTKGWQVIASFIQRSIAWPDPKEYHSREEVILPYSEAFGASELARKIGQYIGQQDKIIKSLLEKDEEDVKSYAIGE